jgi:hypothetical protein
LPIENERAEGLVSSEEGDKDQVPLEEEQDSHGEEPCEEDHRDDEESNKLLPKKRSGEEVNGSSCGVSSSLQSTDREIGIIINGFCLRGHRRRPT